MEIKIKGKTLKLAIKALGNDSGDLNYGGYHDLESKKTDNLDIVVHLDHLPLDSLDKLRKVMKENEEPATRQVSKLVNALRDPANKGLPALAQFPLMLGTYLKSADHPWLFSLDAEMRGVAYLPIEAGYQEPRDRSDAWAYLILAYNANMQFKTYRIAIQKSEVGCSIPQILRQHNLVVPDETLVEEHGKITDRFLKFSKMHGEQFWGRRKAPEVNARDNWWSSRGDHDLSYMGKATKVVLDIEDTQDRSRRTTLSSIHDASMPVPYHPVLPVFSLAHHTNLWVNVCNLREYKYETDLADRLILPKSHRRLISALVSNLEVLRMESDAEDRSRTIRAKASSSILLAKGPPGTGKTLTAEVYAEEIQRPLYEVQSGQIGIEPESIENNLQEILARSVRLRMPLLINEADVFVQSRGRDLTQNAVVSVFLRLLEYHNGLIFLTTNRADDIDDAVVSRCIAEILYETPKAPERLKLWKVLLKEFNVELSEKDLAGAVEAFPTVSGRDIQNLIRLTSRVCVAVEEPFELKALKDNAVFRGIEVSK